MILHGHPAPHPGIPLCVCRQNPVPNSDGWPLRTGQDFLSNHALPGIDYLSIHMWPDNWGRTDLDFGKIWMNGHLAQARLLGRPLVLEEFGKAGSGESHPARPIHTLSCCPIPEERCCA